MKIYSTNDARTNFSELLDISRREPIAISKHGRKTNILLAIEDYERLAKIEDEWWISHTACSISSKSDSKNIDQAIKEMKKGEFIKADIIEC